MHETDLYMREGIDNINPSKDPLALTPGSKSLLWDQSAALFLLNDRAFQQVGGHWEWKLPLAELQNRWTSAVNNVGSVSSW